MSKPGKLFASAAALLFATAVHACGFFVYEGMYRVFLLRPEVAGLHELSPYYFTTNTLFDDERSISTSMVPAQRRNIAEWRTCLKDAVPAEAIDEALYRTDPTLFWDEEERLLRENAFLKYLAARDTLALTYVRYARRCEQLVNYDDPWQLEGRDWQGITRAEAEGERLWKRASNAFLKARIGYQLVRLAYYRPCTAGELDSIYAQRMVPFMRDSWTGPSARFYIASADSSLYGLSRSFDEAIDKRFRCAALFPRDHYDAALREARNDHERAVMHVMATIHRRGRALAELERIQRLDPHNAFLPFLLVREVNKIEDWLWTPELTGYPPATRSSWWSYEENNNAVSNVALATDLAYAQRVHRFLHTALAGCAPDQRAAYELIAAHVALVAGSLDDADEHLGRAAELPMPERAHQEVQLRMERVLVRLMRNPHLDPAVEQEIMAVDRALTTSDDAVDAHIMRDQFHLYIAHRLLEAGDVARGTFMISRSGRAYGETYWDLVTPFDVLQERGAPADFDAMIALLDKPRKSVFEQWLTSGKVRRSTGYWESDTLTISREELLDLKSMWYAKRDLLKEALTTLEQVPDSFWARYPYTMFAQDDPFRVDVGDPHNYAKRDRYFYNKRQYVSEMLRLKEEAAHDPAKAALDNYLLGNAYFNMSWHGKYWIMCKTRWSGSEDIDHDALPMPAPDGGYYSLARAKPYYLKAARLTKDPALKALATYMAAYCKRPDDPSDRAFERVPRELTTADEREAYTDIVECVRYDAFVERYR